MDANNSSSKPSFTATPSLSPYSLDPPPRPRQQLPSSPLPHSGSRTRRHGPKTGSAAIDPAWSRIMVPLAFLLALPTILSELSKSLRLIVQESVRQQQAALGPPPTNGSGKRKKKVAAPPPRPVFEELAPAKELLAPPVPARQPSDPELMLDTSIPPLCELERSFSCPDLSAAIAAGNVAASARRNSRRGSALAQDIAETAAAESGRRRAGTNPTAAAPVTVKGDREEDGNPRDSGVFGLETDTDAEPDQLHHARDDSESVQFADLMALDDHVRHHHHTDDEDDEDATSLSGGSASASASSPRPVVTLWDATSTAMVASPWTTPARTSHHAHVTYPGSPIAIRHTGALSASPTSTSAAPWWSSRFTIVGPVSPRARRTMYIVEDDHVPRGLPATRVLIPTPAAEAARVHAVYTLAASLGIDESLLELVEVVPPPADSSSSTAALVAAWHPAGSVADRARSRPLSVSEARAVVGFALIHMCLLAELDLAFSAFKLDYVLVRRVPGEEADTKELNMAHLVLAGFQNLHQIDPATTSASSSDDAIPVPAQLAIVQLLAAVSRAMAQNDMTALAAHLPGLGDSVGGSADASGAPLTWSRLREALATWDHGAV
ncbi:hypothetical protein H9P43_005698 [Blastocladiella emersonii ATCC 22665]|nr:hypothetical protein H9P43_005698 [Blastocladiella emersonii ATCC 22665]